MEDSHLLDMFTRTSHGVLVTIKRDGRPQISPILFGLDPAARTAQISVTATRAKTHNARRDPRVSLYVESADGWSYAVAEGRAELTDEARDPGDEAVEALVSYYRALGGEHPDWDEYRQVMVAERRLLMTVHMERFYGLSR